METTTTKINLQKADPNYYKAGSKPEIRDLDTYNYLTIAGEGSPEAPAFNEAIQAIYAVAYGIKFLCKGQDNDFVVPKMECYWFIAGGPEVQHKFAETPMEQWLWKIQMRMPDVVEREHFDQAMHKAVVDKGLSSLEGLKFELINEGKCVQVMHIGSWDQEGPSIEKIMNLIKEEGLQITGYHKEIYISEPTKVDESRKKTILRYQVR
ncbi:MAG: GyrI-like domain-containing protein [Cyclobacteriaceae bacterium]